MSSSSQQSARVYEQGDAVAPCDGRHLQQRGTQLKSHPSYQCNMTTSCHKCACPSLPSPLPAAIATATASASVTGAGSVTGWLAAACIAKGMSLSRKMHEGPLACSPDGRCPFETGCPPALLLVTVIMTRGMLLWPFSLMNACISGAVDTVMNKEQQRQTIQMLANPLALS